MADKTKLCKHCKTEIPKDASVCPQCRKRLSTSPAVGCLAIAILGFFVVVLVGICSGPGTQRTQAPKSRPSTSKAQPQKQATGTQTFTLNDGSQLTAENVRPAQDWACGSRKTGRLRLPDGQTGDVWLYFDRKGQLFSVNVPQAGNEKIYDNSQGRECLMNWKTNQMELLTEDEYKRFEKEAEKQ